MNISKRTKIIIGFILSSIIVTTIVLGATNPNDYYVFVGSMNNLKMVNENEINMSFPAYYIPVTSSATYTFTSNDITATLNTSMTVPQNLFRIKNAIKEDAIRQGFNLKKIVYQPYDIVNP